MNLLAYIVQHPVFLVGVGGAIGSNLRYGAGCLIRYAAVGSAMPIATTAINIVGSFVLGCVAASVDDRLHPRYLFLGVGLCGGFTTFSTFSLEVVEGLQQGRTSEAFLLCVLNVLGGCLALYAGFALFQAK